MGNYLFFRPINLFAVLLITVILTSCGGSSGGGGGSGDASGDGNGGGSVITKTVTISWNANLESAVNSTGGGYKVYYSTTSGFAIGSAISVDVPYTSGSYAPTSTDISLEPGTYYFKIVAYSGINTDGSEPSDQISLAVSE